MCAQIKRYDGERWVTESSGAQFNKFLNQNSDLKGLYDFCGIHNQELVRGKVLITGISIENALLSILESFLIESDFTTRLLQENGKGKETNPPLGTLYGRELACCSMGLISKQEAET